MDVHEKFCVLHFLSLNEQTFIKNYCHCECNLFGLIWNFSGSVHQDQLDIRNNRYRVCLLQIKKFQDEHHG